MLSPKAKQNATAVAASTEDGNFTWEMSETFISTLQIGVVEFLSVFNIFSRKILQFIFRKIIL